MVQIRQGHLSRCHGDKVTPGDDLISPWISTCVSECVLHENAVIPPPYQMQRFTLKPNLKVKLLLFLHILTVSLFLFLTLKFLCNILAISFFFLLCLSGAFLPTYSFFFASLPVQLSDEERGQGTVLSSEGLWCSGGRTENSHWLPSWLWLIYGQKCKHCRTKKEKKR